MSGVAEVDGPAMPRPGELWASRGGEVVGVIGLTDVLLPGNIWRDGVAVRRPGGGLACMSLAVFLIRFRRVEDEQEGGDDGGQG